MNERYLFSKHGMVYHDRWSLSECCNSDQLTAYDSSDAPPDGKRLCLHCHRQQRIKALFTPQRS